MILVTGALSGKKISVPISNIGLAIAMTRKEVDNNRYPINFTKILLKRKVISVSIDGEEEEIKCVDCKETPEQIIKKVNKLK